MKEVISIKYEWNTIMIGLRNQVQNLLTVKIHTSCKISKFCEYFRGARKPTLANKYNFKNNFFVRFMYEGDVTPS